MCLLRVLSTKRCFKLLFSLFIEELCITTSILGSLVAILVDDDT